MIQSMGLMTLCVCSCNEANNDRLIVELPGEFTGL